MKEIIGIWWLNDIIFVYKRKLQMLQASKMFGHFAGFADAYDVIVGSGIFAPGHVKEDCFEELVRIVKPGKTMILPPQSAAYMRQWIGSALVQMMAWRLFGDKPLSKPVLSYCQLNI